MLDYLNLHWLFFTAAINFVVALVTSAHVVLNKRDTRAAIAWVGLIWLTPLIGVVLYFWLGINRIQRRARLLRSGRLRPEPTLQQEPCPMYLLVDALSPENHHLLSLTTLVNAISHRPLLAGNSVVPLVDGDQAYPAMIRAIDDATRSVSLSTYIFDDDRIGKLFVDSLKRAVAAQARFWTETTGFHQFPQREKYWREEFQTARTNTLRVFDTRFSVR